MFRREVSRTENRMRFVPKAVSVCISEGYGADCSKVASMRTRHDTAAARQRPALSGFRLRVSVGVGYLADGVRDGRRCKERLPALPTILRPSRAARRSPDGRWAGAFVRNLAPPPLMDRISPSRTSADSSADGLLAGTAASGCAGSFAGKTLKELPDGCSGEKLRKTKAVGGNAPHYRPSRTDGFNSGRSGASLRESPSRTPRGRRRLPRGARRSDRSVCARRVSGSCRRCGRRRTKDGR